MEEMKPRERVLKALVKETPDRVPWMENDIEEEIQISLMDGRTDFTPGEFCRKLGMSAFGYHFPSGEKAQAGQAMQAKDAFKDSYYHPKQITFDFVPPWIAEMETDADSGRTFIKKGLLKDKSSLSLFDQFLPDPDHPARYEQVAKWIEEYKEDFAVFCRIRLGSASLLESMGIEVWAYSIYDDPDLVKEVHRRFSEWSARVVEHLNQLDIDFLWVNDDHADTKSPWMNLDMYYEFFHPYQKIVADTIKKPWIFHSDGNLFPILEGLLTLGMDAIHPIQPSAMDISRMKREYGEKVCIVGNIDLDYTLTLGTPDEVEQEVKERIAQAGKGGGYIISSANSITNYCKVENILAMSKAIRKYGTYPLAP